MSKFIQTDKVAQPALANHDSAILDLAFAMDCTSSMVDYIDSAKRNIELIVKEITESEQSDMRLALVEYRDHPPQDETFVTCVHDFTDDISQMQIWLNNCIAAGGGDIPEAVADALDAVTKLSWRNESTKICILISDAPPHGLNPAGDKFPTGCPLGHDPARIVREMAEEHITLYTVGVEPPIVCYRDFFMGLAYVTGGQYVPMIDAQLLAKIIIGGVREEISLDRLMKNALPDIQFEMEKADAEGVDEKTKVKRFGEIFYSRNLRAKKMTNIHGALTHAATDGYALCPDMAEMRIQFQLQSTNLQNSFDISKYTTSPHEFDCELMEDQPISEDQAARMFQKWQKQKK